MPTVFCACGEKFVVAEQHIGRRIKCGRCGRTFEVVVPPEFEPRRSPPPRDPYRDSSSYRSEPPRDPYRNDPYGNAPPRGGNDPYRNDPYRRPPPRREDPYRDRGRQDSYHRDEEYFDDPPVDEGQGFSLEQVSGFFTPKVRLFLFIAFAALALMSAGLLFSTMKPVGNSLPAGSSGEP